MDLSTRDDGPWQMEKVESDGPGRTYELVYRGEPEDYGDAQLASFADAGVWGVRLLSTRAADTPRECDIADGAELSVAEALRLRPLPHHVEGGECQCIYLPISRQ